MTRKATNESRWIFFTASSCLTTRKDMVHIHPNAFKVWLFSRHRRMKTNKYFFETCIYMYSVWTRESFCIHVMIAAVVIFLIIFQIIQVAMASETFLTFYNGNKMPAIGYGTWRVSWFFSLNICSTNPNVDQIFIKWFLKDQC